MKLLIIISIFIFSINAYCDSLKILFLGDTYFGESYQTNPKYNDGVNAIEKYGYDYFFENVKYLLAESDFTVANLETSLFQTGEVKFPGKPYSHWSYGEKTCEILKFYKIKCVSIGNNHVMDYGSEGLTETVKHLNENNIDFFGAGENKVAAGKPFIKIFINEKDTFRLAVIGGFEYRPNYNILYNSYAEVNKPGVNGIDINEIANMVKNLKKQYNDICIVFFPHWGKNYKRVMDYQIEAAHNLIDSGVNLIIGHGAHTIQDIEVYNGGLILYNIGNFIFNAPGRYKSTGALPYSYMVKMTVNLKKIKIRLIPVYVNNLECNYQIRLLNEAEQQKMRIPEYEID